MMNIIHGIDVYSGDIKELDSKKISMVVSLVFVKKH